jgi:hypothetical protein
LITSITESSIYAYISGTTACYNTAGTGSFTVDVAATAQTGKTISKVNFPATVSSGGDDTASPYSWTYSWATTSTYSGTATVTAYDSASQTGTCTFTVTRDITPPTGDITHSPFSVTSVNTVTYTATGSDAGCSGLNRIEIYVDGSLKNTSTSSPCIYSGGPYGADTTHNYYAKFYDNVNNLFVTSTKSFTVTEPPQPTCNLVSASVAANCGGGLDPLACESGETITMSGAYSNDCSLANLFQIDANDGGACVLEYSVPPAVMSGISDSSITLSGGTVGSAVWTIPTIAASCLDKTVSAQAAALWNGVPGSGTWLDGAETVTGSFKFAAPCSGTISLSLSPNPVYTSGAVTPTASGLSSCNGKTVSFRKDSCSGAQVSSCTASGTGCPGNNFLAPAVANSYTYYACIDKNGDGDYSDAGESGSAVLIVQEAQPSTCNLISASVAANCAGGLSADCEAGETITMSGAYSGDCSLANLFQIDANDGGSCVLEYSVPPAVMSGISDSSITLSGGTVSNAAWTVPTIVDACKGKTVNAVAARLWHGLPGGAGPSYLAGIVSGSFKFATVSPTTTTTTNPPSPCVPFTLVIKPGWNLISLPCWHVDSVTQDGCGATNGNFYTYDAATGKWNVQTVGIASLKKATSYWFYSTRYCSVTVQASGNVGANDIALSKNDWNDVGAPKGGMSNLAELNNKCRNCAGNTCTSIEVKYYDTAAREFKTPTSLQEGVGYRVKCAGT